MTAEVAESVRLALARIRIVPLAVDLVDSIARTGRM
jgi:hypothetical protein